MVVGALAEAGVDTLFALSGNQIMSLFDACLDANIDIVHARHEAAVVHMAEAYAQISGRIGIALVTAGAGVGNAIGALYGAAESNTPVLLLSGDSPVTQDGKGAFQELDQVSITSVVTRWSYRVISGESLLHDLSKAFQLAQSPYPGPVHLAIPADVLMQPCGRSEANPDVQRIDAGLPDVGALVAALTDAKNGLILTGPSLNTTRQPALCHQLQEVFDLPVINLESPRGLNDPSLGNFKSLLARADVVVSLGKRIDFSVRFGIDFTAKWYGVFATQALAEQAALNLQGKLARAVVADPLAVATQLVHAATPQQRPGQWREQLQQATRARQQDEADSDLSPVSVLSEVQRAIVRCGHAILVCDGGEFGQWAQACLSVNTRVINGLSGSIGGGIGYAIGAARAAPDATVFILSGDGSIGFHLAEIETAVRSHASIVIIVGNDSRWNAEHQLQIREFGEDRLTSCELGEVNYGAVCGALGGRGEKVKSTHELQQALASLPRRGVTCIDIDLDGLVAPNFPD